MDIFIQNVPRDVNHIELQIFFKDKLQQLDILAYEVKKCRAKNGRPFAILTVADANRGNTFLKLFGSRGRQAPLLQMNFRGEAFRFQQSNNPAQPLKIRSLQEKEALMRAKMRDQKQAIESLPKAKPNFPFDSLSTGVWDYHSERELVFDQKFKDVRQGYVTFGKSELVLYLQQSRQAPYDWHCRIDIPYAILVHVVVNPGAAQLASIMLTLKTPPKLYKIQSTNDLHLYTGKTNASIDPFVTALQEMNLATQPKVQRLQRLCSLHNEYDKNSALCMVYRIDFAHNRTCRQATTFLKEYIVDQKNRLLNDVPLEASASIEAEFATIDNMLSTYSPSIPSEFDFAVRFQLLALVLEGTIAPLHMQKLIQLMHIMAPRWGSELTANAIRQLGHQIPTPGPQTDANNFELSTIAQLLQENVEKAKRLQVTQQDLNSKQRKHEHLVLTYKATVTPTGMVLRGPEWVVSNRVLRKYSKHSENFMRVFFADEDGLSVFHDPRASQEKVYERFHKVLSDGISIAGRKYDFLGFSHASLRCHQAWFMAPFTYNKSELQARDVIADLGDFSHIHCSAKCAARIGQAFSDTVFAIPIPKDAYVTEVKDDIERNDRCFSDGCGTISLDLMRKVWRALPPHRRDLVPTVLQIRYRGAKGVLSLDKSLPGEQLHIRKSMTKYTAKESWRDLELCGAAFRPLTVFLNHQFIKILEDLGIPIDKFKAVQHDAVAVLKRMTEHPLNTASFLEYSHSGVHAKVPSLIVSMHQIGISFHEDRFLTDIVEVAAMSHLRSIKYRARIPIEKGYLLYGIMDETDTLREGEVYIATQNCDDTGSRKRRILIGDRVVVTRAPALHPGDVQIVRAVDVPDGSPLRALHNCIVFSQRGARDLPSQLSGGDLDGDLFHIIYDERLIPDFTHPPADYPATSARDLGRPVNVTDIVDFFVEYMNMDRLGQISNKHKIRADTKPEGTRHPDCIVLAELASKAVDFSKSGIPADMSVIPQGIDYIRPDFMAPGPNLAINELGAAELEELQQDDVDDPGVLDVLDSDKPRFRYYKSEKALGVLYRDVDEIDFFRQMRRSFDAARRKTFDETLIKKLERYIDRETKGVQWDHHWDFAETLREYYEGNMLEIMDTLRPHRGKPLTELEVFSGNILGKKERAPSRHIREANIEVQERFDRDVRAIIRRILAGDSDKEDEDDAETLPRAVACFKVALETTGWGNYRILQSWKYVAAAVCLEQLWKYQGGRLRPL